MKRKLKQGASILLAGAILAVTFGGCSQGGYQPKNKSLDKNEQVTLRICGNSETNVAIDAVALEFAKVYPNCNVIYEYLQSYEEMLETRLDATDDVVDIYFTNNIQIGSNTEKYAAKSIELFSQSEYLDLSSTFDGLIENYVYDTAASAADRKIYSLPIGGELRGMYVNKTLLKKYGLEVPKNYTELMSACEKLKSEGLIPFYGNPGNFGQVFIYPYICSLIANAENYTEMFTKVDTRAEGVSEIFREPLSRLYNIVEKGYYDYNTAKQAVGEFQPSEISLHACYFFNVFENADGQLAKVDDVGFIPFTIGTMSSIEYFNRCADDYDSKIEYEFILNPIGDDGGFAYLSPAKGIAVNTNSQQKDWALEFLNFLFDETNNRFYAEKANLIPNTKDALEYISEKYPSANGKAFDLGKVTFSYRFYETITSVIVPISKCNNPKYMIDDGNGGVVMPSFESFMEQLDEAFKNVE